MILDNKITKSIAPFIGTIIILCGYIKFSIYYNHFNIKINEYVEFTEILTLFLPDALYYGGLMVGVILFNFLIKSKTEMENSAEVHFSIKDNSNIFERLKKYYLILKEFFWLMGFLLIYFLITFIWFKEKFAERIDFGKNLFIVFGFVLLMFEIRHKYRKVYKKDTNPTYHNIFLILFLFGFIVFSTVKSDIKETETNPILVSFNYKDKIIESDKVLIYLGQTKNYLFLYDKNRKESLIFERSEISHFDITVANNS